MSISWKSKVDLDHLFNFIQINEQENQEPLKVIDEMLSDSSKTSRVKRKPNKYTPQKSTVSRKPSGICPKCNVFVERGEDGVVCGSCAAYWHYRCAEVTHEILDRDWSGIEFLCTQHREERNINSNLENVEEINRKKVDMVVSNIKIHSYSLDVKTRLKQKLANIAGEMAIEEKDGGRQYTINLNSVTYQLIVDNMVTLGDLLGGIDVKRDDVDNKGANVQTQFIAAIGSNINASITCFHTTNNMLLQLMGRTTNNMILDRKIDTLRKFINFNFVNMVKMIESASMYGKMQDILRLKLEQGIQSSGPVDLSIGWCICPRSELTDNNECEQLNQELGNVQMDDTGKLEADLADLTDEIGQSSNDSSSIGERKSEDEDDIVPVEIVAGELECSNLGRDVTHTCVQGGIDDGRLDVHPDVIDKPVVDELDVDSSVIPEEKSNSEKSDEPVLINTDVVDTADSGFLTQTKAKNNAVARKDAINVNRRKINQSFNLLRKADTNENERNNYLFNIIVKLKERAEELKVAPTLMFKPSAYEQINQLTLHLVGKQNENEKLKAKNKAYEIKVKDFKKEKSAWEEEQKQLLKKIEDHTSRSTEMSDKTEKLTTELKKREEEIDHLMQVNVTGEKKVDGLSHELVEKNEQIVGYKNINDKLREELAVLGKKISNMTDNEVVLSNKVKVLEAVAGEVRSDGDNDLVILTQKDNGWKKEAEKELADLKEKLKQANVDNSLLRDEIEEIKSKDSSIDVYYQALLDEKDLTIKEFSRMKEGEKKDSTMLKRLLIKFRSEQELKFIKDLKASLEIVENQDGRSILEDEEQTSTVGDDSNRHNSVTPNDGHVENSISRSPGKIKKGLCREGKMCPHQDSCQFRHEMINKPCRFKNCNKKDKCLFIHKLNESAEVKQGGYSGNSLQKYNGYNNTSVVDGQVLDGGYRGSWGHDSGTRRDELVYERHGSYRQDINYAHEHIHSEDGTRGWFPESDQNHNRRSTYNQESTKKRLCRQGALCNTSGCGSYHTPILKPCRDGMSCVHRTTTCLFMHEGAKRNGGFENLESNVPNGGLGNLDSAGAKCRQTHGDNQVWLRQSKN